MWNIKWIEKNCTKKSCENKWNICEHKSIKTKINKSHMKNVFVSGKTNFVNWLARQSAQLACWIS